VSEELCVFVEVVNPEGDIKQLEGRGNSEEFEDKKEGA